MMLRSTGIHFNAVDCRLSPYTLRWESGQLEWEAASCWNLKCKCLGRPVRIDTDAVVFRQGEVGFEALHASMPRAAFVMRDLFRAVAYMHNSKDPWQETLTTSQNYGMSLQVSMQSCCQESGQTASRCIASDLKSTLMYNVLCRLRSPTATWPADRHNCIWLAICIFYCQCRYINAIHMILWQYLFWFWADDL